MTTTDTEGNEIILEPGDPGYVDPNAPPAEPVSAPAPPPQNLEHVRGPHETDAEFAARTRGAVVHSESPSDVVPNTPQISMSPQEAQPTEEPTSPPPSPQEGETEPSA